MKSSLCKIITAVSCFLGFIAILMLFSSGITIKADGKSTAYSMMKITIGYKETVPVLGEMQVFKFSFPNLLTYIFILAGMVTAGFVLKRGNGKLLSLVSASLFIIGGILYFCANKMVMADGLMKLVKDNFKLGYGAIIGGILSILAAVCVTVPAFLKKN